MVESVFPRLTYEPDSGKYLSRRVINQNQLSCHKGLFEFNMMPFGMSNSPSIFSELMTAVLEGINGKFTAAYMDDIIIWPETPEEHLVHLQQVFDRLESAGLKLKHSKCKFFQTELKYLGHIISSKGIRPDPEKIRVIVDLAPPESVKEIRSFVGMCSFYRRYIPHFSHVVEPLNALAKKHAEFHWSNAC